MKRAWVGVIVSALLVGGLAYGAEAQRGRRRQRQRQHAPAGERPAPHSDQIGELLGELRWGMTKDEVLQVLRRQIRQRYQPRLAQAPGAIEEDRIRFQMNREIARLGEDFIEFDGDRTGYDSNFLRAEFTHRNREAMLRVRGENGDEYLFFIRNQFWKKYRAFDRSTFRGANFDQFAEALQRRYGEAVIRSGKLHPADDHETQWLEWQNESSRARALDNTTFYGFFSIVIEAKEVLQQLDSLRTHEAPGQREIHPLVDAVTQEPDAE